MPFPSSRRFRAAGVLTLALGAAGPALAAPGDDDGIGAIEAKIRRLQAELRAVAREEAAHQTALRAAAAEAAAARAEAREANARAAAIEGGAQSFSGSAVAGLGGATAPNPAPAGELNGLGGHAIGTAGQQKATPIGSGGRFQLGGLTITLGGFIEADAIVRSRNETADITTTWNAIPYAQSPAYHEPEFRGSARNSRLALLIQAQPAPATALTGYFETDFKTAGVSSNSNESNSYALDLRQAYAAVDRTDWGFHFLAGQAWSLITMDRIGITPREEQIPLTIDSGYVPGFNWLRNWQLRFAKDFDNRRIWAAVSFESPQTSTYVNSASNTGAIGGTVNYSNTGGSLLNSTANYSTDIAPDVIAKLAFDPSFGHYELVAVGRFFSDRFTSTVADVSGHNNTVLAGGAGGGFILPLAGPRLTFQASGLAGQGIGRYGASQLPDSTIGSRGQAIPIPEVEALLGVVYHPTPFWDLYAYAGTEQEAKRSYNETINGRRASFGYGNGYYVDAGCATEGSPLTCTGNTRGIAQGTLGAWWRFLHGTYGTLQVGTQWSYTRRTAFEGTGATAGSTLTPRTDENVVLFSFRYLPFL